MKWLCGRVIIKTGLLILFDLVELGEGSATLHWSFEKWRKSVPEQGQIEA